jgi:uncharacterized membrane protein
MPDLKAEAPPGPSVRTRVIQAVAVVLAVITIIGLVLLRPTGEARPDVRALGTFAGVYRAEVQRLTEKPCAATPDAASPCLLVTYRLLEGPDEGSTGSLEGQAESGRLQALSEGDEVLLGFQPQAAPDFRYVFVDRSRNSALLWLVALFACAVVLLGRARGVAALAGLAATIGVLLLFVVPSILDGRSPVLVSAVGASAISYFALYLAHGFSVRTTTALLGTIGGLACTVLLASLFTEAAALTGAVGEEAVALSALGASIDLRGLTLGGMIIGALGAIDDMTITQASAVWELRQADPQMSTGNLRRAGRRIGRDHVASTVNTLVLAYAGASMPVLILVVLASQPLGAVLNNEILTTEIVRTLVGSIGLVASVPITTWIAAQAASSPDPSSLQIAGSGQGGPSEIAIPERRRDAWLPKRRRE